MSTIEFDNVRLMSAGGVPHKVVDGLRFAGDDEKVSASLGVIIRATDFADFLDELFPQPIVITDNLISIQPRMYLVNAPWLRAKSFSTEPVEAGKPQDPFNADPTAQEGTYAQLMKVMIEFETMQESEDEPPQEGSPETFLDHSINAGAEFLQLPPSQTKTSDGDSMCPECQDPANAVDPPAFHPNQDPQLGIAKIIPTIEHSLKWKFVIRPNWTAIFQRLGMVNSAQIPLFNNAHRETVLFTGVSGQRSYRYFRRRVSQTPWSLDFKFSQRCVYENGRTRGWNHVYSPSKGWVKLKRVDNSFLYEATDFTQLFTAGS